jgi:hypothetical protein
MVALDVLLKVSHRALSATESWLGGCRPDEAIRVLSPITVLNNHLEGGEIRE